jgi:transglutaminase-like putative cysteine protease
MSKTGWTMTAAALLVVTAVALGVTRRVVLGPDIEGEQGWLVTLKVAGELPGGTKTLSLPLPPEFRHQHIWGESLEGTGLTPPPQPRRRPAARRVIWHRPADAGDRSLPFSLTYSFRAQVGVGKPTGGMNQGTQRLDRTPPDKSLLLASHLVQSDAPAVRNRARELVEAVPDAEAQVRALFDFVADLDTGTAKGASLCLKRNAGSSIGKARLLVALCRSRGLYARLLTGIVLTGEHKPLLHSWAEVWAHGHWLPMDPTSHHFGADDFPTPPNYLVLNIGDSGYRPGQGRNIRVNCDVQDLSSGGNNPQQATPLRAFFLRTSLYSLRPAEQHLVRFLLLLPLAALVVNVYRTVIGVPTFGTFSPALLGLAFLDMRALRWGLPIFVLIILLGWAMRHGLERFHLLQVPRASALLTLIVALLIVLLVVANRFGLSGTNYISLFPLVILTHLVERFWTIEAEDGTMSSFKTLVGTVVVAVTVSVALSSEAVGSWMSRYPETLIAVLAAHLALGRYTGYRLSELYRFGDIIHEESSELGARRAEWPKKDSAADGPNGDGARQPERPTPNSELRTPN